MEDGRGKEAMEKISRVRREKTVESEGGEKRDGEDQTKRNQ